MKKILFTLLIVLFCTFHGTVHAAISFDAASDSAGSASWNHTTSGSNRYLVVWILGNSTDTVTGVTYNGVSMTRLVAAIDSADRWTYLYGLANPTIGTNSISVSGGIGYAIATSYDGVAQTGQPDATGHAFSVPFPITLTFSTMANNSWVIYGCYAEDASSISASTGTTLRRILSIDNRMGMFDSGGPVTPAGSYSGSITGTGTAAGELLGASLSPAASPSIIGTAIFMIKSFFRVKGFLTIK